MKNVIAAFKLPEIRNKILIVLLLLASFRALAAIPIPGVDLARLELLLGQSQILGFLNIFSGGGLSSLSLVMLGVGPYITATIIMQLLTMVSPKLKAMYSEEGPSGRTKFNRYSRYLTVPLAVLQGYSFLQLLAANGVLPNLGLFALMENLILITTGSLIVMWFGELIGEQKIGNGISIIIFAGIVSGLPGTLTQMYNQFTPSDLTLYITLAVLTVLVTAAIVIVSEGERKVPVTYAKRVRGNKIYGGATSYLPLKVNQAGMIPIIFAVSIVFFPQFIAQITGLFNQDLSTTLSYYVDGFLNNQLLFISFYFILVFAFTYFYTAITFNPEEISKSLQQGGGFVPGIRPGEPTTVYLKNIVSKITFFGALFLAVIAIVPNVIQLFTNTQSLTVGSVALLIVVAVVIDIVRQINSQVTVRQYE
ncbi:MAG: preprotein translocase subunit SecY [Candidatus Harrisonbacteria bacterium CG10_big_fil_rev_8_21_14_0_10_38_8]|uniref:Protein translocase subunit SecY n=1 Tax=Candidatus Harrisonbacteria bacterium CG10_big_fil_rev_8_21_14_0_10_38_8 TaxID=1974582 RepID=A0A2M6WK50_9BACT|nr:MAG: preprotein translocase subunit SecY [Candidatus Harrisonbacteria bacterium CG10_big_fil_rev_8_21_14_0_10_38_8]